MGIFDYTDERTGSGTDEALGIAASFDDGFVLADGTFVVTKDYGVGQKRARTASAAAPPVMKPVTSDVPSADDDDIYAAIDMDDDICPIDDTY